MDICRREKPPFFKVDDDHEAACFLYDQSVEEHKKETATP
jgi:hypothetical protein